MPQNNALLTEKDLEIIEINDRLKTLSIEQLNDLITRYYNGEKLKYLKNDYDLPGHYDGLLSLFPPLVLKKKCIYCSSKLLKRRESRDPYGQYRRTIAYCQDCGHEEKDNCRCTNCIEKEKKEKQQEILRQKEEEEEKKQKIIKVLEERKAKERAKEKLIHLFYHRRYLPVDEDSLDLEDILYLSTLLRCGLSEDMKVIEPVENYVKSVTPTYAFTYDMLSHLFRKRIILPSPKSSLESFKEDNFPSIINVWGVHYDVNINPKDGDNKLALYRMLYPTEENIEFDKKKCFALWKKVALNECIEYLSHSLNKVGYTHDNGEKTTSILLDMLNYFSVSQIYYIIFRSIAYATKLDKENKLSQSHLANISINNIVKYAERAVAEKWKVHSFGRDFDLPETMISKVLHDKILQISSLGFSEVPTENF